MTVMAKTELKLKHDFDPKTCRHFLNGVVTVLHCHHFATLYSQLADDAELTDGKKLLFDTAEETFQPILSKYFCENELATIKDRVTVAEEYYGAVGMGKLRVVSLGRSSGTVELTRSHLDEGWKKKWGQRDKPVNFITQGFVAAMFAAVLDQPIGSFRVEELQSIVSGAEKSVFRVVHK